MKDELIMQKRLKTTNKLFKMQMAMFILMIILFVIELICTFIVFKRATFEKNHEQKYCSVYVNEGETLETIYGDILTSYPNTKEEIEYTKWKEEVMQMNFMENEEVVSNRFYTITYIE